MVLSQSLPSSAEQYGRDQRAEIGAAVSAVLRQWRRMGEDFDSSYALIEPSLLQITDVAQSRIAVAAEEYIPAVLAETGQSRSVAPRFNVNVLSLVGTTGDGLTTEGLLYGAVIHAKQLVGAGASASQALGSSSSWLSTSVGTLLSDTGRASEGLATAARPVTGWVRMLEPPSCGRCVALAGKFFKRNAGFQRHPKCDCRHIPSTESVAGDFTVDPRAYFDSLDEAGQAHMVGSIANARAVREFDADPSQLINSYRKATGGPSSMQTAQVYGRDVKYTTEGTTRRGLAHKSMAHAGYARQQTNVRLKGERYFRARSPRLMPESIAKIATNKADEKRLLGLYGWLL